MPTRRTAVPLSGTWCRPRLMWWLRTDLWVATVSRLRALGPAMLPPSVHVSSGCGFRAFQHAASPSVRMARQSLIESVLDTRARNSSVL